MGVCRSIGCDQVGCNIIDIGGGSTEFILMENPENIRLISASVGSVGIDLMDG